MPHSLKILISSTTGFLPENGNGRSHVHDFALAAARRGHEVVVVSFRRVEDNTRTRARRVTVLDSVVIEELDITLRGAPAHLPFGLSPSALSAVRECLVRHRPDVVHAYGWSSSFARVCHDMNIPCVITAHHWGLVCPDGTLFDWEGKVCDRPVRRDTCASCCRRSLPAGPLIDRLLQLAPENTIRWADSFLATHRSIPLLTPAIRMTTGPDRLMESVRALALPGNLIVAPSRSVATALIRNGVPEDRVVLVPHGIVPFARSPLQPQLGERPVRFVFVGRIDNVKGLHVLLSAFSQLRRSEKWELHIAGEAGTKEGKQYHSWLLDEELDWSRITWHGHLERDDVGELLATCDVVVVPSIGLQLFPLVIPEAFSVGRMVVATRCGAAEDLIRDGVDGLLVEPRNVDKLDEALRSLIRNPSRIEEMAANIAPVRTVDQQVRDLEAVYARAISCSASLSV